MNSLKQQLPILVIGPLVILSIIMTTILGMHMKDRALLATATKAESDMKMGETVIDLMYPGDWEVNGGILYKGNKKISNNAAVVDKIAKLTGDTVTIFLGDVRVATTVREKTGARAIGTRASDVVGNTVLKNGQNYLGEANVVGEIYQTAYKPIRDSNGKIIGMFYVGISKNFSNEMIRNSLLRIVSISVGLTVLVSIGALYFAKQAIVEPLEQITLGTKAVASGRHYDKVKVDSPNEIGELAHSFNKMLETMQQLATQLNQKSSPLKPFSEFANDPNLFSPGQGNLDIDTMQSQLASVRAEFSAPINQNTEAKQRPVESEEQPEQGADIVDEIPELPKGLNDSTYRQILYYLQNQSCALSAEEVGEGVKLTRVTARRYLEFLEQQGSVTVELKYGTVGRPVKLYVYRVQQVKVSM